MHSPFDVRIFHRQCRSLADAGHEVILIAPHDRDETVHGVHVKAIPRFTGRIQRMTSGVAHAYREARRQDADIYEFHDPELIPAGLLLQAQGRRVICDIHEDLPRTIDDKTYLPRRLRTPIRWLSELVENSTCRWFSGLIAATPEIADRFRHVNCNTVVVHNYPALDELGPSSTRPFCEREMAVAYVGGITRERGIRELVEAMRLLPANLSPRLKLAGPFSPAGLKDEVARLPGWERVNFMGFLDRTQVASLLSNVRAGLVVLHPAQNFLRSKPVKLFEYMSAGIPVIASHFPEWREMVEGAGLLVDPLKPSSIAEAIEFLITHPAEAEAMGRRGRELVEMQYNWSSEKETLLRFYDQVLSDRRQQVSVKAVAAESGRTR